MKTHLEKGDKITLLPAAELYDVFNYRCFFGDRTIRFEYAWKLGCKPGTVTSIESKYALDYFYFVPDDDPGTSYSIPYESVDFQASLKMVSGDELVRKGVLNNKQL